MKVQRYLGDAASDFMSTGSSTADTILKTVSNLVPMVINYKTQSAQLKLAKQQALANQTYSLNPNSIQYSNQYASQQAQPQEYQQSSGINSNILLLGGLGLVAVLLLNRKK